MVLSSSERDDLVRRVEQKLGRTAVGAQPVRAQLERAQLERAQLVRDVVDRTLGALPDTAPAAPPARVTAVFAATSTPDLASRVRQALAGRNVMADLVGSATEGRHTVVAVRVPASAGESLRSIATVIGARVSWRSEGT